MAHVDPDVLALMALGEAAASPADEQHLPGCQECRSELEQLSRVTAMARAAGPDEAPGESPAGPDGWLTQPPPDLWARVAAEAGVSADSAAGLTAGPAAGPETGPAPQRARPPGRPSQRARPPGRRAPWWRVAAAAAAAALIGAAAAVGIQRLQAAPGPAVVGTSALRPLAQFPQWHGARGTVVLEQGQDGRELRVTLQAPRRPGFFEVWLLARDGVSMIALGELNQSRTGVFGLPPGVDLADYSRVDVSLQPFNGSPVHSEDSVVRGTVPGPASAR